jgi:hypothetical protein
VILCLLEYFNYEMPTSTDRDLFLVSMRIVALISGFYLLCGGSLTVLKLVYMNHVVSNSNAMASSSGASGAETLSISSNHGGTSSVAHDGGASLSHSGQHDTSYLTNTFSSFRSIALNGLLLPSMLWVLSQRLAVAIGMSLLVASVVDVFRSVVDYTVSTYVIHAIVSTCVLHGFPMSAAWWTIIVCECAFVVIVSEVLVARKQRNSMIRAVRRLEDADESEIGVKASTVGSHMSRDCVA